MAVVVYRLVYESEDLPPSLIDAALTGIFGILFHKQNNSISLASRQSLNSYSPFPSSTTATLLAAPSGLQIP